MCARWFTCKLAALPFWLRTLFRDYKRETTSSLHFFLFVGSLDGGHFAPGSIWYTRRQRLSRSSDSTRVADATDKQTDRQTDTPRARWKGRKLSDRSRDSRPTYGFRYGDSTFLPSKLGMVVGCKLAQHITCTSCLPSLSELSVFYACPWKAALQATPDFGYMDYVCIGSEITVWRLVFSASKVAFSWPSVDRFGKNFEGLMTWPGQVSQLPVDQMRSS